jgi:hypothetical protein
MKDNLDQSIVELNQAIETENNKQKEEEVVLREIHDELQEALNLLKQVL